MSKKGVSIVIAVILILSFPLTAHSYSVGNQLMNAFTNHVINPLHKNVVEPIQNLNKVLEEVRKRAEEKKKRYDRNDKAKENLIRLETTASNFLIDNLAPKPLEGYENAKYNKYPLSHYYLDLILSDQSVWEIGETLKDTGYIILHHALNAIWYINILVCRLGLWVFESSMTIDFVNSISTSLGNAVKTFAGLNGQTLTNFGIWGMFLPIMIIMLGVWVGWKVLIQDNPEEAQRGFLTSILIILASFVFFNNASSIATKANEISTEISANIMAITMNIINPSSQPETSDQAIIRAGEAFWHITVLQPFKLMEFGTTNPENHSVRMRILEKPPNSKDRTSMLLAEVRPREIQNGKVVGYNNINVTIANIPNRLMFIPLVFMVNILITCVLAVSSVLILAYQLYFILLIMLAPVALIWAVVPVWKSFAASWAVECLGALLYKIALGILLGLHFSLSTAIYDFSINRGGHYIEMALLQICWVLVVIYKRYTIMHFILDPIYALIGGRSAPKGGNLPIIPKLTNKLYDHVSSHVKSRVEEFTGIRKRRNQAKRLQKYEKFWDSVEDIENRVENAKQIAVDTTKNSIRRGTRYLVNKSRSGIQNTITKLRKRKAAPSTTSSSSTEIAQEEPIIAYATIRKRRPYPVVDFLPSPVAEYLPSPIPTVNSQSTSIAGYLPSRKQGNISSHKPYRSRIKRTTKYTLVKKRTDGKKNPKILAKKGKNL